MFEKLLNETEKLLIDQEEKEVPILDLWQMMIKHSKKHRYEVPVNVRDFECLLEADKRFVFIKPDIQLPEVELGEDEGDYEVGEDYFEVEEIEKVGFDERQLVGLQSKVEDTADSYGENTDEGDYALHSAHAHPHTKKQSVSHTGKNETHKKNTSSTKKKPAPKRKK